MRVCQFRHFGTSSTGTQPNLNETWLFTANAASLRYAQVSQSSPCLSNAAANRRLPQPLHPTVWPLFHRPDRRFAGHDFALEAFNAMTDIQAGPIPGCHAAEIRRLVHDLSNALEIIVQTNYLLKLGKPDEATTQWLNLMDTGVKQATDISLNLRRYIVEHAAGK
jgi:hypothetical protein